MTFSKIKNSGWTENEKIKSPQITQLDIDHANSFDKTGETGIAYLNSGGIFNGKAGSTIEADGYFTTGSGCVSSIDGYVTFLGNLTISANPTTIDGGVVATFQSGSRLEMSSGSTIQTDADSTSNLGGTLTLSGALSVPVTGSITLNSGANMTANNGSTVDIDGYFGINGSIQVAVTTNNSNMYSVTSTDYYIIADTSGGVVNAVLPVATSGRVLYLVQKGSNNANFYPHGSELLNGSNASVSAGATHAALIAVCDGTNWQINKLSAP